MQNDEIKEILDNVRKCCDITKDQSFVVYQRQDILKLLDYITNLQQENQDLSRMCELYGKSLYNAELTDYKSRIEKAVEYIKKHRAKYFPSGCGDVIEYVPLEFKRDYYENGSTFTETENLLDILDVKE